MSSSRLRRNLSGEKGHSNGARENSQRPFISCFWRSLFAAERMLLNQAAPASTALTFPKKSSKTRTTQFQPAPVPLPALPAGAGTRGNHVRASRSSTHLLIYLFFFFQPLKRGLPSFVCRSHSEDHLHNHPDGLRVFFFFLSRGKLSHLQGRHSSASHAYVPRKRSTTSPLHPPPFQPFWKPKSGSDPSFSAT